MSFADIIEIMDNVNAECIVLLCHQNADPDAICSAYAFSKLLKQFRSNLLVEIGVPKGISRLTKHILKHLPIELEMQPHVKNADVIALLDTNTVQQLSKIAEEVKAAKAPIIVIDHHASHPETEKLARLCIVNEEASSTSEIVYELFRQMDVKPEKQVAEALFLGIAFDTRHFILANASTLKYIADLIVVGVEAQKMLSLLSLPMDFSERVARLKACKRAKLLKVGEWIIASSHVSSYQASAARAMIELGAHVAVVAGQRNKNLDISLRSSREFNRKTGVHLGRDIAKPLGEYLHGMGGGHSTAAGANGIGDIDIGLKRCLGLLKGKITNT